MSVRLLVADDHEVIRTGLKSLLADSDIDVVAEAATGKEAVEEAEKSKPDVILLDIRMPDGDGLTTLEKLRAVVPARSPEGKQVRQPLRFTGIDGPRWFVRAVFLGRAAVEPDPTDDLHEVVRQMIVVRGDEAMAPRDPLPLRLPESPPEGMAPDGVEADTDDDGADDGADDEDAPDADDGGRFSDIDPFERGPEITEVR